MLRDAELKPPVKIGVPLMVGRSGLPSSVPTNAWMPLTLALLDVKLALIEKLKTQKGIVIEHAVIPEANHFFEDCIDELHMVVGAYLDKRLGMPRHAPPAVRKERAKSSLPQRDNR